MLEIVECIKICNDMYEKYKEHRDREIIMEHLDQVHNEIQTLGAKLDEQTIREAKTGLTHLVDGFNSEINEVKASEFQMARSIFSSIIHLDPKGTTTGITDNYNNAYLIGVGYYGNFYYFNYHKDYKNALAQVYKCCLKCPDMALRLFPAKFFSKNYIELIEIARTDFLSAMNELKKTDSENFNKTFAYYSKVGIAGFGLLTAGVLTGLFFPSILLLALAKGVATGGGRAINEFAGDANLSPTDNLKNKIKNADMTLKSLYSDLNNECNKALSDLEEYAHLETLTPHPMRRRMKIVRSNINIKDQQNAHIQQAEDLSLEVSKATLQEYSAWLSKGDALYRLEKYKEALQAYNKAIKLYSRDAKAWARKGDAAYHIGSNTDAIQAYDKANELGPTWAVPWKSKGYALYELGKYDEAMKALDKAIELDPKDSYARYYRDNSIKRKNGR